MNPRTGKIQLTGPWPVQGGAVVVPTGTFLSFKEWRFNGMALPWPPPVTCQAQDQESYNELLKHYEPHRVANPPQQTPKFGGEERQRAASRMSNISIEQAIENATTFSKAFPQMADQLVGALTEMKEERDAIEVDLEKKREEHRQVEESIAAARRELADVQAQRNKILDMFTRGVSNAA
jgi:hypothetical protein